MTHKNKEKKRKKW